MDSITQFLGGLPGGNSQVSLVVFAAVAFIVLKIIKEARDMVGTKPAVKDDVCQSHSQQVTSIAELCVEIRNLNDVLRELKESIKDGFSESWQRLREVENRVSVVETRMKDSHG